MFGTKKALALLIACALLIAATPSAGAATVFDFTGTWTGTNGYYEMTIAFYDDYTYDTIIRQGNQQVEVSGSYSMDEAFLYFFPYGGQPSALNYYLSGNTLALYEAQSGDTVYLDRQQSSANIPANATIPEGLVGTWTGLNDGRTVFLTFSGDGISALAFDRPDAPPTMGPFTAANGILEAKFSDGTQLYQQFMLAGDTLVLADANQTTTLTRYQAPAPTAAPLQPTEAPTAAPASANLVGTWLGGDDAGVRRLELTADNRVSLFSAKDSDAPRGGAYANDGNALTITFDDGTALTYQYLLMGDSLILMGGEETGPSTLARQTESTESTEPAESTAPSQSASGLTGTWGGLAGGVYEEITFQEGAFTRFIPSDPGAGKVGTYEEFPEKLTVRTGEDSEEMDFAVQGDALTLTKGDASSTYARKPGPLSRQPLPEQPAAATVDAALVGAWGDAQGDVYREIAFYADGTFEEFTPQDEAREKGTYMAQGGMLAMLLPTGARQGNYTIGETLTIAWASGKTTTYAKMPGALARSVQPAN